MAKLTVSRLFEVSLIAKSRAYEELKSFVDYVNSLADNVVRILTNGVTIKDNLAAQSVAIDMRHNKVQVINFNKRPSVILVGKQYPITPHITSFAWQNLDGTDASLVVKFDTTSQDYKLSVTFIAFFD